MEHRDATYITSDKNYETKEYTESVVSTNSNDKDSLEQLIEIFKDRCYEYLLSIKSIDSESAISLDELIANVEVPPELYLYLYFDELRENKIEDKSIENLNTREEAIYSEEYGVTYMSIIEDV
jgi:hypothetical protein